MRRILLSLVFLSLTFIVNAQNYNNGLAKQLVSKNAAVIGLSQDDLNNYIVSSTYFNQTSGTQMVYLLQGYKGLPVMNQMLVLAFKDGNLISKAGGFLPNMDQLTNGRPASAGTTASDAVRTAITKYNIAMPASVTARFTMADSKKIDFGTMGIAKENVTAELMWAPVIDNGRMTAIKLAWQVALFPINKPDYWNVCIDANNNTFINENNLTVSDAIEMANATHLTQDTYITWDPNTAKTQPATTASGANSLFTLTEKENTTTNSPSLVTTVNYTVIPYPAEAPSFPGGTAAIRTNPWTLAGGNAVTLGWHNDGTLDYTTSRGNNVHAHEDQANNNSNAGIMAISTTTPDPLNFTYAGQPNYTVAPTTPGFQQFAITNLFYWNNICHDITYKYGFDEPSGNFQNSNLGRGGLGADYVQADAQDGGGLNNANFATPVDGTRPRMQMYLFSPASGVLTFVVNSPASIAGPYTAVEGAMSTNNLLGNVGPRTANLVYYNDVAAATHEACVAPSNGAALAGKIALINRGNCTFVTKILNAQAAGAIGVVMVNNVPGPPIVMGGTDNTIVTPAIMISDVDGATIAAQLNNPFVNVTMSSTPPGTVQLDGDIDNGIVNHEFFHGVSNRLTGGPANSSCLNNAEQGGEGWSDYNALMLGTDWSIALATDGFNKKRPIGTYAFGQPPTGNGIRLYPYCTNININPLTYANMGVAPVGTEVHNIGEIWCMALWEMTWGLIQTDGINTNLFNNAAPGGNSVAYKLVMEGLKLQPCNPGYIDARNAILQADQNLYGGAHYCTIYAAFAKRGMGFGASQGSPFSATDQTPSFALPPGAAFTTQPSNTTACNGTSASFTVVVTNGLTYQWQLSTAGVGGPFSNIPVGAPYSGINTATLTINPVANSMNGYAYRCVATSQCGSGTSNAAVLTVIAAAVGGTVSPANNNVCSTPNSTTFTLSGNVGPVANWESSIVGAGGPYTTIPGTAGAQTYTATNVVVTTWYRAVIAASGCTPATSTVGSVTVLPGGLPMFIVADPGTTACAGDPTRLTVQEGIATIPTTVTCSSSQAITSGNSVACNAGGLHTDNSYWRAFQLALTGALTINSVSFGIELANAAGVGTTQPVTVRIYTNSGAAFPGGVRTLVASQTYNIPDQNLSIYTATLTTPVTVPSNAALVLEIFTPSGQAAGHSFFIGSNAAPQTCASYISAAACGLANPTDLAAIGFPNMHIVMNVLGTIQGNGTVVTGGTFLWSPAAGLSSTSTNPVAASPAVTTTYTVTHDNGAGCIRTAQITINITPRPVVTSNPANTTVCAGSSASFTVAGTGAGLTYQWQFSTDNGVTYNNVPAAAPYTGTQTVTLTINPTTLAMNGYRYRAVLSGTCPPGLGNPNISSGAILNINALPAVSITPPGPLCGGVAGVFGVSLSTGAVVLPPVPGSLTVNSGTISVAIPDGVAAATTNVLNVAGIPANAVITNISVGLSMPHTYPADMVINLKSPNGQILSLYKHNTQTDNGAASIPTAGFFNAVVDALSAVQFKAVPTPYRYGITAPAGPYKPDVLNGTVNAGYPLGSDPTGYVSNAAAFSGLYTTGASTNGAWTLAMADLGGGDNGTLTNWNIKIDYNTPAPGSPITYIWSPAAGLYIDPTATTPYVAGASVGTVYAAPTATTTYTVTANDGTTGCSNTASVLVYATPPPPLVTPNPVSMCLGDPAVRLISTSAIPGTCTVSSGTISLIPTDGSATPTLSTLNVNCVPAGATITGMSVNLTMPHTYPADMIFNLKAPNGKILDLYKHNTNTDNGATSIPTAGFFNAAISSASAVQFKTVPTPYRYGITAPAGPYQADNLNGVTNPGYTIMDPTGYVSNAAGFPDVYSVPNGTWTLAMADGGGGDVGTLTNWSITINYIVGVQSTQAMWSPATFLWLDQAQTQPYVAGTQHDTVYTRPTPAGVYTYNVTVNSIPPPPVTVNTPMAGGNGNNMVFFNLRNTTGTNYTLKSISTNAFSSGTVPTVNLWMKTTAPIAGNPGAITNANGWNIVGTASGVAVTANTLNQVISNMNVSMPAGANYGVGLEFIGGIVPAYTNGTGTIQTYTNNGINIITDGNVGWGGPVAPGPPANNPRNFNGAVTLTAPGGLCTSPARVVTVTVNNPIVITVQPINHSVCTNGTTSFTVAATGTNVTYQWQVSTNAGNTWTNITNNANYSGSTTNTLTITNPPVAWNGYFYRVVVNGAVPCPSVPSNNVVLTVNPLPTVVIAASPYQNLLPGLTTTIFSTSTPAAATYTWYRNNTVVSGQTGSSIIVNINGLGSYYVSVTDVNGCTNNSNIVTIGDSTSPRVWIYPNPTAGIFQVRYNPAHNNVSPRGLNIRDAQGKLVYTQKYTLGIPFAAMNVDLSNMASGVYWVEVVDVDDQRLAVGRVEILH